MAQEIILITGASSGIGLAAAHVITQDSSKYHVIIAARSLDKAEGAKSEIEAKGIKGQLSTVQLDVTDEESIAKAAASVESRFGRLDTLVNNAGISSYAADIKTQYQETFNTNVIGPRLVSEAFRPLLLKSSNPRSIYVSSSVGSITLSADPQSPYYAIPAAAYGSSKAALNRFVQTEIMQAKDLPLKIFVICPGLVRSNLRGKNEEAVSAGGRAGDAAESGRLILSLIEGKRDADVGKFVHKDGLYPW